jgi:hypothetical protein
MRAREMTKQIKYVERHVGPWVEIGYELVGVDRIRLAPPGKWRVIGVDTFDRTDWVEGDFDTRDEAVKHAKSRGGQMLKMHVYDDQGKHVADAGKF